MANNKKKNVVVEDIVITEKEYVESDREILNKIKVGVYIAIAILILNTILIGVYMSGSEANSKTLTQQTQNTDYDISMFNEVNGDEFVKKVKGSKLEVIVMAREDCGYCAQFLPTLQQSVREYDYTLNYLDINKVGADTKAVEDIKGLGEFFAENFGVTPIVVFVKDGKVINQLVGAAEYNTYTALLEKNNISKK